jgi:hypothetical protein
MKHQLNQVISIVLGLSYVFFMGFYAEISDALPPSVKAIL